MPKKINKTSIGGQAVMEGVMMRGYSSMATAVRDADGVIRVETERLTPLKEKSFIYRMPVVRGVINFFSSLVFGTKILMRSAEVIGEGEPSKFEKWLSEKLRIDLYDVVMFIGVALGLALSIGLFIVAPNVLMQWLDGYFGLGSKSVWYNLIEGGFRITIFIAYILLTSLMKDIKRVYMYHGAEHKTISCYEYGWELTVENVRKASRVHERCGTTFMFFVMMISILVFSLANWFIGAEGALRILVKIALLPVVAGLSYELLKGLAKTDLPIFYIFKAPGLLLQRITTREPDDGMIEVAITSFKTVLEMDADKSVKPKKFVMATPCKKLVEDVFAMLKEGGVEDRSDAEWIVAICSGKKRSELETEELIPVKAVERAFEVVKKRVTGMPLWYVLGDTDFYGRTFKVDERALIPRPETEELVSKALDYINKESKVLDLCTGSGAIAVTIALEKGCNVKASDVSEKALSLAEENAKALGADVEFIKGDMFENVGAGYDVIVSNPPYIRTADIDGLARETCFEPRIALDGGEDGLDFYRVITKEAPARLKENGVLLLECGYDQKDAIIDLLTGFSSVECIKDLEGKDRIIKAVK